MVFLNKAQKWRSFPQLSYLLLPVLAILLYANTTFNGFTLDDVVVITKNKYVQQGLSGIPSIFGSDSFEGYYQQENRATLITGGRYRPLSLFFFAVLFEPAGPNPLPFHLFNLLLYAVTCIVLLKSLTLLFEPEVKGSSLLPTLASFLFVIHPLHSEVVNNIKSADELLSLLLSMSALYLSLKSLDTHRFKYALLAGLAYSLACFSKENALPFLVIIPLAALLFRKSAYQNKPYFFKILFPLVVGAIAYLVARGVVLNWKFGQPSDVLINNPFLKWNGSGWVPFSFSEWSATNFYSIGYYFKLLFIPFPLTHDYYPRQIGIMTWSDWEVILSAGIYFCLCCLLLFPKQIDKTYRFSIFFYLLSLSIVSNFLFPIGTNLSERFAYMPSLGFCIAAGFLIAGIPKKSVQIGLFSVILLVAGRQIFYRNQDWKTNFTLTEADYKASSNSAKINNSYAAQLLEKALKSNSTTEKNNLIAQSLKYYAKALEINPNYMEALFGRGSARFVSGDAVNAVNDYLSVEKMDPNFPNLSTNLTLSLREAGKQMLAANNQAAALNYLKSAQIRYAADPEINRLLNQIQSTQN